MRNGLIQPGLRSQVNFRKSRVKPSTLHAGRPLLSELFQLTQNMPEKWALAETRKLNLFSYSGQGWHRACTQGRAGGMQGTQRRAWARDGFSWCGMSYGTCRHLGEGSWLLWWRELPLPSTRPGRYVGQLLYCPNIFPIRSFVGNSDDSVGFISQFPKAILLSLITLV